MKHAFTSPRIGTLLLLGALIFFPLTTAHAQLTLTLDRPQLSGPVGQPFSYFGTLTNTGTVDLTLFSDSYSYISSAFTFDDTAFYANAYPGGTALVLSANGGTASFDCFDLQGTAAQSVGSRADGFFSVQAVDAGGLLYDTGDQPFSATVAAVPEMGTGVLLGLGLLPLAAGLLWQRRRQNRLL